MSAGSKKAVSYAKSIFINCPFDSKYEPIFWSIIFTVQDLGFTARCALEKDDSGENRLEKILDIIGQCKYGLHDISRAERNSPDLPRFNMPLELGLFLGCRRFGTTKHRQKNCLILDEEKYRYLEFVTDLRGVDIKSHNNDPQRVVAAVRKWLGPAPERTKLYGASRIWDRFQEFEMDLPEICRDRGVTPADLSFVERVQFMEAFIIELDSRES